MDAPKRILVIDDDAAVLFVLQDILAKLGQGYETVTCSNGSDALLEFEKAPFDLVMTDLRMPGMDGIELTQMVQNLVPGTAVIWLTAYGYADSEQEAKRLRVYRCLDKPVEASELQRIVRETLASHPGHDNHGAT
jgi:DNA-binding NtrC family response regulator